MSFLCFARFWERLRLIKEKVKEVLGRDVEINLKDVDTDVNVKPNFNQLVTTNGIVRGEIVYLS